MIPPKAYGMLSASVPNMGVMFIVGSSLPITACSAAIKAKELPRKVGIRPLVHRWKIRVPTPAANSATLTSRPVRMGTRMVAQDMAKACWSPSSVIFPAPSFGYSLLAGKSS